MTRKHFMALAAAIADIRDEHSRHDIARAVAIVCRTLNSNFDADRFYVAANVDGSAINRTQHN